MEQEDILFGQGSEDCGSLKREEDGMCSGSPIPPEGSRDPLLASTISQAALSLSAVCT
jgi:hypothetical protein